MKLASDSALDSDFLKNTLIETMSPDGTRTRCAARESSTHSCNLPPPPFRSPTRLSQTHRSPILPPNQSPAPPGRRRHSHLQDRRPPALTARPGPCRASRSAEHGVRTAGVVIWPPSVPTRQTAVSEPRDEVNLSEPKSESRFLFLPVFSSFFSSALSRFSRSR